MQMLAGLDAAVRRFRQVLWNSENRMALAELHITSARYCHQPSHGVPTTGSSEKTHRTQLPYEILIPPTANATFSFFTLPAKQEALHIIDIRG